MPTFIHGRNTTVLIDQFDFSGWFREVTSSAEVETAETTAFSTATKPAKSYIAGFADGTFSLSGMFDGSVDAVDEEFQLRLGQADDTLFTIAPAGTTVGNRVFMAQALPTSYEITSPVSDIVGISLEAQVDGGLRGGVSLHPHTTARTSTADGTSVDQLASSTSGAVAQLHVLSVAGTGSPTLTVDVQHSSDNVSFVDLLNFTAATTVTSQRLTVAQGTTINRYVRAQWTISGSSPSFTFCVSWGRL